MNGVDIEVVHNLNFLESTISYDGDCSRKITRKTVLGKVSKKGSQRI